MKLNVGLDVSSEKLDACFLGDEPQDIYLETSFSNDTVGASKIKQKVLDDLKVPKNEESRQSYSKTYLSDYSNQNPFEWFAEAVALGCINDENKKNKLISPLVENEIKNIIAGKGEVYEELKRSALKFLQESLI